jgi:cobalt-zinc-cadmium resistance protein CzcA
MFNRLILFSIQNKAIIGMMTLGIVVYGLYSFTQLPIDAVPDITNNQVQIYTLTPTLATQEVEQLVSAPIERSLASVPDVEEIRSISRFGLSIVTVVFKEKVDIYFARQLVRERLEEANQNIPDGLGTPELSPVSTGLGEIYQYLVEADSLHRDQYDAMKLREIQDWIVSRQILGTPGIAEVNSFGGLSKQYEVAVDPYKLQSKNVTIAEVFNALENNNENTGGGYIDKKPNAYFIRGIGLIKSLEEVGNIKVKKIDGVPIYIKDIANVQFGSGTRYGAMTADGNGEVVGGIVMMLKGYNSAQVVADIKAKLPTIEKSLPEGVTIRAFLDRTDLVNRSMSTVKKNLIEGALIVIFVLILFLGNLRAGLIVASVIPLAMFFAIILMNLFHVSGNLMSLGAIDFGLIVDGAVIIVEATMHFLGVKHLGKKLNQAQMNDAVFESASKIRSAAAFGEIIILIVYLPILTLVGIEGKMFVPMAQTVGFAIIGALILSLTYVPMMSSLFLSKNIDSKVNFSDRLINRLQQIYLPIIQWALRKKQLIIASSICLFVASFLVFSSLGGEFIPTLEEGDFAFHSILPQGSSINESIENNARVEKILKRFPEVKRVVAKSGAPDIPTDPMPPEATDMMILLKDKDEWTTAQTKEELMDTMMKALKVIPGVFYEASQPIQMRFNELMTGVRQDVAVKIFGENLDSLLKYGEQIEALIASVDGASEPQLERVNGLPQLVIRYKRENIANYDLNIKDVNRIIRTAFSGEVAGQIFENERRFDLVVRMDKELRTDIADLKRLLITIPNGMQIPLEQLATVNLEQGPAQISREETKRRIVVGFNVAGRDVQSVVKDLQKKIDEEVKLPSGYYATYGGQFQNLVQASNRLMITVPIALLLIFFLLYVTFKSAKEALLIYSAIPLSAIGGVLALWMRDMPFSISAGVGFIALFGVAVLNGIVLISTFNDLEKEGFTLYERVIEGTKIRLRPVLMTATVASLGFLPMALSSSAGAEVQKPLATVVIGGLLSATILTLLVLPVLYIVFNARLKKLPNNLKAATSSVFLLIICTNAIGQSKQEITSDVAIQTALLQNNYSLAAGMKVEYFKKLEQASSEIEKANFSIMYGQYNSFYKDQNISFSQSIPFPTVFAKQKKVNEQQSKLANSTKLEIENSLKFQVRQCYDNIQFLKAYLVLLKTQDSLYMRLLKGAELRYKTGEGTFLEVSTITSKLSEIRNQILLTETDVESQHITFKTLLNVDFEVTTIKMDSLQVVNTFAFDTLSILENPLLKRVREEILLLSVSQELQKAHLLPDISIGYFNQSMFGTTNYANDDEIANGRTRFQGVTLGVSIPLWSKPQLSRIQANNILEIASKTELDAMTSQVNTQYLIAFNDYRKNLESVNYYLNFALKTAQETLVAADKSLNSGEIGYFEFAFAVDQALQIQKDYTNAVFQLNQTINNIKYLTGI